MGQPVVHFEIISRDGAAAQAFYGELFGWDINADNPMHYGVVERESAQTDGGIGIGGGVAGGPEGYDGHVTFYVQMDDVEEGLAKAESLGGTRLFGPEEIMPGLVIGQFTDPEGRMIGIVNTAR
jgi:predicted enzyme related to lactoylglutathione lyase